MLSECRLLICNDTGISHVAAAVGAASVVLACASDVSRWAPPDASRHRVLAHDVACRLAHTPNAPSDILARSA